LLINGHCLESAKQNILANLVLNLLLLFVRRWQVTHRQKWRRFMNTDNGISFYYGVSLSLSG